jgi:hypothetical protein
MNMTRTFLATAISVTILIGPANAGCAGASDALALKTAAVQQELMVAAFQCGDTDAYNRFVISYQRDLQNSDAALLAYFERTNAQSGEANYHSYKTSLANDFSLISARSDRFCGAANAAFSSALDSDHPMLAQFVSAQPVTLSEDGGTCDGVSVTTDRSRPRNVPTEEADGSTEMVGGASSDNDTRMANRMPD